VLHRIFLILLAVAAFGAAVPAAGVPLPAIPARVTIGGVPVGGLTTEEARTKVEARFGQPIRLYRGERSWSVTPAELGAAAGVRNALIRALHAGRATAVRLNVGVNHEAVKRYVGHIAKRYHRPAVSAKLIGLKNLAPAFTESKDGQKVDRRTLTDDLVRALHTTFRGGQLLVPLKAIEPKITSIDFGPIVVIRRGSNKLYLYQGATLARTFGVATGQEQYPTPLGEWHVVTMQRNPWWIPPDSKWARDAKPIPPGPGNPLGTRWMGLDAAGVGIHGTPDAASIGYSASHGCIRMRIPDAETLFTLIHVGTPVYVVSA